MNNKIIPKMPEPPKNRKSCQCLKFWCKYRNDSNYDCKGRKI